MTVQYVFCFDKNLYMTQSSIIDYFSTYFSIEEFIVDILDIRKYGYGIITLADKYKFMQIKGDK